MKQLCLLFVLITLISCQGQNQDLNTKTVKTDSVKTTQKQPNKIELYTNKNQDNGLPSKSNGTVGNGSLTNGKLFPFNGTNFHYFDSTSYLSDRAFVNDKVKLAVLETYTEMKNELPDQEFCIMECSNKTGGKIFPHRTHQNGLSVDFMMPLIQDQKPYYGLDSIGQKHYLLVFDDSGKYLDNKNISVNFDLVAKHILILNQQAIKHKLRISKVIIKVEFKDELFSTPNGQKLKNSTIYITKQLDPLINSLHDDHYHVDFEEVN